MRPSRYAFPAALLCAAGLSIGLCFCVITSFAVPADPVRLLLACFLAAALFSAVFLLKKSWIWLQSALLLLDVGAAFLDFLLVFGAAFQNLFFCFKKYLSLLIFGTFDCLIQNSRMLFFGAGNLLFSLTLTNEPASNNTGAQRNCSYNVTNPSHDMLP